MSNPATPPRIWVLADTRPGTAAQALGVAEKLGLPYEVKQLEYTWLAGLPNILLGASLAGLSRATPLFIPGALVPNMVIAAGRRAAPIARWIKQQLPDVRLVHLMRPVGGEKEFDLIAVPEHDAMRPAPNVIRTLLTPHRLTTSLLAAEGEKWRAKFSHLPAPRVALLVGGSSKHGDFSAGDICTLTTLAEEQAAGGSLLVTTSRRTGKANEDILHAALKEFVMPAKAGIQPDPGLRRDDNNKYYFYAPGDGGDNPYLAYLALAERIIVTGDSISMISEAVFTGKPVYIFEGVASPKHRAFQQLLYQRGLAAPLGGSNKPAPHAGLDSAADIARVIREKLDI